MSPDTYRELVESMPHLVWTCDHEGRCDYLSPQWVAYTGVPALEQLGFGWLEQLHPDDVELTQERWTAAATAGRPFDTEFRIRRHDGAHRWFKTRAVPELDDAGTIVRWFGTNTDIQELRDAQHAESALASELERRVAEQTRELRAANDRLGTLAIQLETAQRITRVGSWEMDVASGRVDWSDELYRVFGLSPQEGAPPYEQQTRLFAPESWDRLTASVQRSVETGEGYELFLTAIDVEGHRRATVARAETLRDAEGRVAKLVGTFQDISDRERAATELRRLNERFQLAAGAAHIGVWEWDLVDDSLVWDDTMHRIYDTDPETFGGAYDAWRSALHPEDLAPAEQLLQDSVAGTAEFRTIFRIVRRDGEVRYIRAESDIARGADGRALRVTGVNWDITDQRVAEITLRRAEAVQRGILEGAGLSIIATDPEGRISLFNPAAELLLGYRAEELVGVATPGEFHEDEEVEARRRELEEERGVAVSPFEALVSGSECGAPVAREWTYVRKDGSRVPVWLVVSTLRDGGEVVGYLGVAADLTDRKRSEAELVSLNRLLAQRSNDAEAASHAKSMFLANMSHEIRTPIGAITGVTYLLGRTALTEEQTQHVATIERSTRSLLGLVNDVLDLSKIEAGQLSLEVESFPLPEVLDDLARLMAAYSADKGLELIIECDPGLPEQLLADRVRLMQILVNLAGNAIKFTDRGSVRVSAARVGEQLRFEVQDTGVGMDAALSARIFEPFTQSRGAASRPGGTGLGLAIVHELVTLMEGEIGISSTPGRGTRIWVDVPLREAPGDSRRSNVAARRLLLAVAHDAQRSALADHATALGLEVTVARSGGAALAALAQADRAFDLVVLDFELEDHDGLETLERLLQLPVTRPASVIVAGGEVMPGLREDPRATLADVLLAKPITPSLLHDALVRASVVRSGSAHVAPLEPISAAVQRLPGVSVLVADDSDVNRTIARRILELEGATVTEAADGWEAVEQVTRGATPIEAVLMDVQMPIVDGVEAARLVRQDRRFAELPIIALTAGAFRSERERALDAGMTDFITKPYDPETLIASVRAHVSRARGAQVGVATRVGGVERRDGWPTIDGIDAREAETRLGGDTELFRLLLGRLREDIGAARGSRLLSGDRRVSKAWLHKLRGTAGNLGARQLRLRAGEAERAMATEDDALLSPAMEALNAEMQRVVDGIDRADLWEDRRPPAATSESPPLDPTTVERAMRLLEEQSFGAVDVIKEAAPALAARLGASAFADLQTAVAGLDFATARALLATLGPSAAAG